MVAEICMSRMAIAIIVSMVMLVVAFPLVGADDIGAQTDRHIITISLTETGLSVEETITIMNVGQEAVTSLRFWLQQQAKDVSIVMASSGDVLPCTTSGNIRECNLTTANVSFAPDDTLEIKLTYNLPTNTETFEKTVTYETTYISVMFTDQFSHQPLYQLEQAQADSSFSVLLYKPTDTPLSMTSIIIIVLLLILLIASTLLLLRKQRTKVKKSLTDSKVSLTTKKALLLSLLKDIEKKHRGKEISDDTYRKLKDEYKQQAVDVMKKLDDLK